MDDAMKKKSPAMSTALLPQYAASGAMAERFLDAIHHDEHPVDRSTRDNGFQVVDHSELQSDALDFFSANALSMSSSFESELSNDIGTADATIFLETIAVDWYKKPRDAGRSLQLKRSIYEYLQTISSGVSARTFVQVGFRLDGVAPLLQAFKIGRILRLTECFLEKHLHEWIDKHPEGLFTGSDEVYFRRGLSLQEPVDTAQPYWEWDYLNSYSLAVSVSEKFSLPTKKKVGTASDVRALVSGDWRLFQDRVLFFAPFIPTMDPYQLEFGIIPSGKSLAICSQGLHAGVHEYILAPRPLVDDCDTAGWQ